jgi:hypothetical protein
MHVAATYHVLHQRRAQQYLAFGSALAIDGLDEALRYECTQVQ